MYGLARLSNAKSVKSQPVPVADTIFHTTTQLSGNTIFIQRDVDIIYKFYLFTPHRSIESFTVSVYLGMKYEIFKQRINTLSTIETKDGFIHTLELPVFVPSCISSDDRVCLEFNESLDNSTLTTKCGVFKDRSKLPTSFDGKFNIHKKYVYNGDGLLTISSMEICKSLNIEYIRIASEEELDYISLVVGCTDSGFRKEFFRHIYPNLNSIKVPDDNRYYYYIPLEVGDFTITIMKKGKISVEVEYSTEMFLYQSRDGIQLHSFNSSGISIL